MDERVYQPERNKELAMPYGGDACATSIQLKVTNTILMATAVLYVRYGKQVKPFL